MSEQMTREEAIYLLKNTAWLAPSLVPVDEAIDMAINALKNERPKGHWIHYRNKHGIIEHECSVCGDSFTTCDTYGMHYCSNCGADMRQNLVGKHADVTIIDEGANDETGNEVP